MSKNYGLFFFIVFVFSNSFGQDITKNQDNDFQRLVLGAGFGANISFFNDNISEFGVKNSGFNSHFRIAPSIYGTLKYKLNDAAFSESGLLLNFRGGAYIADEKDVIIISSQGGGNAKKHRRFILNYLEVPIMIGYNLRKLFSGKTSKNFKPINLALGVTGAFNLSSSFKANYYRSSGGSGFLVDAKEDFKTIDFDYANAFLGNFLIELSFVTQELKKADMWLNLRYNQSLNNVYSIDELSGNNFKTKMGTFTLGVKFEFLN